MDVMDQVRMQTVFIGNENICKGFLHSFRILQSIDGQKINICFTLHPMIILIMWNILLDMPPAKSEFTVLLTSHWFRDIFTVCDVHLSLSFHSEPLRS